MSWWIEKSREQFSAEIATRFAVNRAEKRHGGVQKFTTKEASSRGGRKTRSTLGLRWGKKTREPEKKSA